ncbi:MAG TPA: alpha/beta fold hydrolase [Longimicrobiaceae bacterium]|nr:alpha/beta fold hydrolase [Longimicrobiaceae bacterium]
MRAPAHHRAVERWLRRQGIRWERVRYPRPEAGGEAAGFRFLPAGAPRARVVVAHGACDDALFPLVALYRALLARGMEVFASDLDGNGWESTTRFAPETIRSAVAAAVREAARGRPGLPLYLAGHSLGGALVLDALARGEVDAEAAAVVATPLGVRITARTAWEELRGFLRPGTLRQYELYGVWGLVPAFGPVKRAAYPFRGEARTGNFDYVRVFDALLRELDLPRAAPRVRVPVLLVYGDRDRIATVAHGEELLRLLPEAELARIPGATHASTVSSPAATQHIAAWLAGRRTRTLA